ncbi:glycosyl hydrolase family 8 [Novosphingobium sp.]|uniref:glycosyl hydrolase family 8 n=1 Tax=Novosphingobium sp. TaxID=1874826 RepID=UPI0028AEECC9|nr:glycosyl hydrolase family 8 [Novosphingobium sp.]
MNLLLDTGINRRNFTLGLMLAMTAACNTDAQSRSPVRDPFWRVWRDTYVKPDGRIVDTGNNGVSHSEGQSYGLLFAYQAGDADAFAKIAAWTQTHLSRADMALHVWRYDPSSPNPVADQNNATDGDLVIAWALGMAGQRWNRGDYTARAAQIRSAIRSHCVIERHGRRLLLPGIQGFVNGDEVTLNPSYFAWPALDAFVRLDGQQVWGPIISDSEAITRLARFGTHRLPSDWIVINGANQVAPARDKPPRFGYDAIRVPLYAAVSGRQSLVPDIAAYWRACLAANKPIPGWIDVVTGEEANYAITAGAAAVVGRLLGSAQPSQLTSDYYAASLQMLARYQ